MDIRPLTETYAVSPQIDPEDFAAIKAAGYTTVIDNRPDHEIPESHHTEVMRAAAEAAGLVFIANPVIGGAITAENIEIQAQVQQETQGPILAYCASGNRSSICWALSHAAELPTDELIDTPARFGYNLEGLRGHLDAAKQG